MMCLIVDANAICLVLARAPLADQKPLQEALFKKRARAVYGGRLAAEYAELRSLTGLIRELDRRGTFYKVADTEVHAITAVVANKGLCESDDPHIIALALVSGARLLCSYDRALHADFTNPLVLSPKGSVYQRKSHAHLIRRHCT